MIAQDNTAKKMDRMYGWQVSIYDGSRKYYLLGRDKLLNSLSLGAENICEIRFELIHFISGLIISPKHSFIF